MKNKPSSAPKKLRLNKETVRQLTSQELRDAAGGYFAPSLFTRCVGGCDTANVECLSKLVKLCA